MAENILTMENIVKTYKMGDEQQTVLKGIDLQVDKGEFVAILGPSGSGKSTLMNIIGCLDTATSGTYHLHGRDVSALSESELARVRSKEIGFIFQSFQLLQRQDALQNVELPLIYAGMSGHERAARAQQMLERVGLKDKMHHFPNQLSGGQQQRVAFARAIVIRPSCILFDEPLSALDALLREQMRQELKDLVASLGLTAVFVTHDQAETMSMSSHIAVLNAGTVEQYDTPESIYHRSTTRFVARFVGKSNWLSETELFRPETASLEEKPGFRRFELPVTGEEYLGESYNVQLQYQDSTWTVHTRHKMPIGEPLSVYIDPTQIIVCKKEKAES